MKKMLILILITTVLLTGCVFAPYRNSKYGSMAIDAWFNDEALGETRKQIESIDQIVSSDCEYLEHSNNKYVFLCEITYTAKGQTVIPLSKHSKMKVYTVFIKKSGNSFDSKVYNSSSKEGVWQSDEYLDY